MDKDNDIKAVDRLFYLEKHLTWNFACSISGLTSLYISYVTLYFNNEEEHIEFALYHLSP